ncbi:PfkB family carbohydrate kinase [Acuticoccus sp. MNP-M23]|uniref:PfkB family carbohydrate kinase n=1 Tax=Acuticoccus sp. MNP-M23 TaxID=3072793 RepID=UPI00281677C9|nr:PfkB family carbohydrate kinase [Acuticoccus sp. MNP-M23]WMS42211.1 PfkB family carbohydrate kinase [Acuticoccus sp. MNP-M23]
MEALFIGHAYIDITFIADQLPTGDEKTIADDYAVAFGGNATTSAFCAAKLGLKPDLLCQQADDWLARMFLEMASRAGVSVHGRKVKHSSLSFIMPKDGKRAIVRCRDDEFIHPAPTLNLTGCRGLHVDGHMADAAIHYAKACREMGVLTSLDGGSARPTTDALLEFIDVAAVSERMCEQMQLNPLAMLDYLRSKGVKVGAVTLGERGLVWYEDGGEAHTMPALAVPAGDVIDTSGAGDVFHGAYFASALTNPERSWADHFEFGRAASAFAVQRLGNEASLPSMDDIATIRSALREAA